MPQVIQNKLNVLKLNLFLSSYIKFYRNLRIIGISASAILTVIMTLTVFPLQTKTHIAEAAPGTSVASDTVLSMTSSASANLNLVVNNSNGTFASSSESELAKFGITTNNYTGYTLSIKGVDDTKQLSTSTGKTLDSISYAMDAGVFGGDTATVFNGKWGYLPSKYNSLNNTEYLPSPTTTASTLDETNSANSESNEYTIALGARADYSTPNGVYSNTFILTVVGNPVNYTIKFDEASGDSGIGNMPATISSSTTDTKIKLPTTVPTRPYYTFEGWCSVKTTSTSDGGTTCTNDEGTTGTIYPASTDTVPSYFYIDQTTANDVTLYAVWTLSAYDVTIKTSAGISSVSLNGVSCTNSSGCIVSSLVAGESYTLTATAATGYSFSSWNAGNNGSIANATSASTTYTVGGGPSTITPSATLNKYTITIKTNTGISSVSLNGTSCTSASGCAVNNLEYGKSYTLTATVNSNYNFSSWSAGSYGSIANASSTSTTYTVGTGVSTITPSATGKPYSITVKMVTGISSIKIGNNTCSIDSAGSGSGCTYLLNYGQGYALVATKSSGYDFSSWSAGSYGSIANAASAITTYVVGAGNSTITPSMKSCTQTISGTMQTYTTAVSSLCSDASGTLTDNRDNQTYAVIRYDSLIWMARNLAIGCNGSGATYGSDRTKRSLTSKNSNVSTTWSTSSALSLDKNDATTGCTTSNTERCNNNSLERMKCDSTYGAWYNYAAATANTIISSGDNASEAQYSICPKGWRLFTNSELQTLQTGAADFKNRFNIVGGGVYEDGVLKRGSEMWLSSTASDGASRYGLYYLNGTLYKNVKNLYRYNGFHVRCVRP